MEKKKNNNTPYIIIVVIIILLFSSILFSNDIKKLIISLEKNNSNTNIEKDVKVDNNIEKKLKILIIDDKRCNNCKTKEIVFQLKDVSSLYNAVFETKDFSES
jgi:thioredoxin-related protein